MFISNNHASFHLWWKKILKHQKSSKYYESGCSLRVAKIVTEIKCDGVWGALEAKKNVSRDNHSQNIWD